MHIFEQIINHQWSQRIHFCINFCFTKNCNLLFQLESVVCVSTRLYVLLLIRKPISMMLIYIVILGKHKFKHIL